MLAQLDGVSGLVASVMYGSGSGLPVMKALGHHLHEPGLQRAIKGAVRANGNLKPATSHTLLDSFATHLLEDRCDIHTVQELPGHSDARATQIYTHVLDRGGLAVRTPLDAT